MEINTKIVTVEKAIKVAWRIRYLSTIPIIIFPIPSIIWVGVKDLPWYYVLIIFLVSFGMVAFITKYATEKWRLWAFQNVDDPKQLLKVAREDNFISPEDNFCDNLPLKERIETVNYELDDEIPALIVIKKDVWGIILSNDLLGLFTMLVLTLLSVFFSAGADVIITLSLGLLIVLMFCIKGLKKLFDPRLKIEIDMNAIVIDNDQKYYWLNIKDECVIPILIWTGRTHGLNFIYNLEEITIPLHNYKIDSNYLIKILRLFRKQVDGR